jgi:hypothetical protein
MRQSMRLIPVLMGLAGGCLLPPASAQSVISARSGLVNFLEGVVFLDGQPLMPRSGSFGRMHDGSVLTTEEGRAEVLLTPDTYIRIGEHSGIRMVSNDISNTQVELLSGSAIVDSAKAAAGDLVRVSFRDATIHFLKPGHYRMDAEPPQLRVDDGEAEVKRAGKTTQLEASQLLPLDGASVVKRFTKGSDGLLDLWSAERGDLIASRMLSASAISDPLLDAGPGVPADFASYVGYIPPASLSLPSTGLAPPPIGWGGLGFGYGGFYPGLYPALEFVAYAGRPAATFLYVPRRPVLNLPGRSVSIFGGRPSVSGTVVAPPRTLFVPRPGVSIGPGSRGGGPVVARPGRPAVGRR